MNVQKWAILVFLFLFQGGILFSGDYYSTADEDFIQGGELQEPLSPEELVYYSLRASGLTPEEAKDYSQTILDEFPIIRNSTASLKTDAEKGEKILELLHRDFLESYSFTQTKINVILETGVYNCVSSAVLYLIFAREAGLYVGGVSAVDHAFCFVDTGVEKIDVETTNPYGFNPGEKKEFKDSFSGKTGYNYVPPKDYKNRFYIGEKDLIGYIFQNRMVEAQKKNNHREAMNLAVNRYAFTRSRIGLRDLYQAVQNMLSDFNNKKQYAEALDFILEMDRRYSVLEVETIRKSSIQMVHNQMVYFLNAGRTEEAEVFYNSLASFTFITEEEKTKFLSMINQKKAEQIVQTQPFPEAVAYIQDAYEKKYIGYKQWKRSMEYLYVNEASRLGKEEGALKAYEFIKVLTPPVSDFPTIKEGLRVYRHNYAVLVHNRFADAYNAGDKQLAGEILNEGIEKIGDYNLLLKDKKLLE